MQLGRHRYRSHLRQRCCNPRQVGAQAACVRVVLQAQFEFGASSAVELGVDLGVNQFKRALVDHFRCPRATNTSRNA